MVGTSSADWSEHLTDREAASLRQAHDRRLAAREAYNALRAKLKSRAEARVRRRDGKARGVTRTLRWFSFEKRGPTQEERDSNRIIGYCPIVNGRGEVTAEWFGKMVFRETDRVWLVEPYSVGGPLDHNLPERIEPTHWAMIPALPATPGSTI
jgi:hypothetical protein